MENQPPMLSSLGFMLTCVRAPLALHGGINVEGKKGKGKHQYRKTQGDKVRRNKFQDVKNVLISYLAITRILQGHENLSLDAAVDAVMNAMENIAIDSNEEFDDQNDCETSGSEPEFVGYSPRKMAAKPCAPPQTRKTAPTAMETRDPPPYQSEPSSSQPPPPAPYFRNEVRPLTEGNSSHITSSGPGTSSQGNQLPGVGARSHPSSSATEPVTQSYRRQNFATPLMTPTSQSQQTPRKLRGPFSAYVVYRSSSRPGVYYDWPTTHSVVNGDRNAVYKGFPTRSMAETCYNLAHQSGIIDLLCHDLGINTEPYYAVVEGTAPGVYLGRYQMLRDGLNWTHGVVYAFRNVDSANSYFVRQFMAGRVITLDPVVDIVP
ncbi:hypothetical protein K435DRAFT_800848 [Dendrothele bispora CBS 962.96]|uniref:Ribonuclease H1 N-terminal domain-containing protein n=1 Tax=Dendrothele bispora (strain CBS 962.96) TaxID=1314807 RepID=A0A4S8LRA9_DENBC|nr:hypothetical protein K435DRAFT_800848 [Dendrothele bispora CBS 962.96]